MPRKVSTNQFICLLSFTLLLSVIFNWCIPTVEAQNPICRRIPKLNPLQIKICENNPDILPVIRTGIQLAIAQCERLFRSLQEVHPAWNCSGWIRNSTNRLFVDITHPEVTGTKEASFANALISAGVTYALSEACTRGNFLHCPCGSVDQDESGNEDYDDRSESNQPVKQKTAQDWQWHGCRHNVDFGSEMARLFLDSHEQHNVSPWSLANLHNNLIGRRVVREKFVSRCQCHGYSGSCSMRTCWRSLNVFPNAANTLLDRYHQAKGVSLSWLMQTYRSRFEAHNHHHQHQYHSRLGSASNVRSRRTKLDWLTRLQTLTLATARLELNEPNANRASHPQVKVAKRDLIYVKQSVDFCALSAQMPLTCEVTTNSSITNLPYENTLNTCNFVCCGREHRPKGRIKSKQEYECVS